MKHLFFTLLVLVIFSCKEINKNNLIQGDIYIKLIDAHSIIYGMPDEKIQKFKERIDNPNQSEYTESEQKLIRYYKILIEHDLFNKPHFKLKLSNGKIVNVYTNKTEYSKLSKYLNKLDRDKEKITMKFEGSKKSEGIYDPDGIFNQAIYHAKRIIFVEKTDGITDWKK